MNVQVACTISGRLAWISDAIDGSRHDSYCLDESGVLLTFAPGNWIGDKGRIRHTGTATEPALRKQHDTPSQPATIPAQLSSHSVNIQVPESRVYGGV
jgi:DDE superfamily endonuclease